MRKEIDYIITTLRSVLEGEPWYGRSVMKLLQDIDPAIVHFTDGVPDMPGYETAAYADEWREELEEWAGGYGPVMLRKTA